MFGLISFILNSNVVRWAFAENALLLHSKRFSHLVGLFRKGDSFASWGFPILNTIIFAFRWVAEAGLEWCLSLQWRQHERDGQSAVQCPLRRQFRQRFFSRTNRSLSLGSLYLSHKCVKWSSLQNSHLIVEEYRCGSYSGDLGHAEVLISDTKDLSRAVDWISAARMGCRSGEKSSCSPDQGDHVWHTVVYSWIWLPHVHYHPRLCARVNPSIQLHSEEHVDKVIQSYRD